MKQSTDIRVKTDQRYEQLYKDLRPFCGEAHAVFFLCFCTGLRAQRKANSTSSRSDRFFSGTIEPDEWACYYAVAVKEHEMDLNVLDDDKRVLQIAESYADGGMELLIEGLLSNYMASDDELRLDTRACSELSWELLKFIPDQLV